MPGDHGAGFNNKHDIFPVRPEAAKCDQEQSVERVRLQAWALGFEDRDLLSEGADFEGNSGARSHRDANR